MFVALKCPGKVFLTAAAPGRSGSVCFTRCLLVRLNLVEWRKVMIVIMSSEL